MVSTKDFSVDQYFEEHVTIEEYMTDQATAIASIIFSAEIYRNKLSTECIRDDFKVVMQPDSITSTGEGTANNLPKIIKLIVKGCQQTSEFEFRADMSKNGVRPIYVRNKFERDYQCPEAQIVTELVSQEIIKDDAAVRGLIYEGDNEHTVVEQFRLSGCQRQAEYTVVEENYGRSMLIIETHAVPENKRPCPSTYQQFQWPLDNDIRLNDQRTYSDGFYLRRLLQCDVSQITVTPITSLSHEDGELNIYSVVGCGQEFLYTSQNWPDAGGNDSWIEPAACLLSNHNR